MCKSCAFDAHDIVENIFPWEIFRKHQMAQPLIAGINLQSLLRQISQAKNSALSCLGSYAWVEDLSPKSIMLRLMQVFIVMHESIIINANA